jgi:predicted GNAT family acetyltransferase
VTAADLVVSDAPDASRYEARLGDDLAGFAQYEVEDGRFVLTHTEVDPAFEGRGVGGTLVRGVLDDLRRQGDRVDVRCPFARSWIERHPDYQGMVD